MRHIDDSQMSDIGLKVNHDRLYLLITGTLLDWPQSLMSFFSVKLIISIR